MTPDEADLLVARATAGTITPAETERLLQACRADPALTRALHRDLKLERLLAFHGNQRSEPGAFVREVMARLEAPPSAPAAFVGRVIQQLPRRKRARIFSFPVPRVLLAAAAVVVGIASLWMLNREPAAVAQLTGVEAIQWTRPPDKWSAGGRLEVAAGFARIKFARGAELILEGPAEIELTGANSAVLHRGAAAVEVPPSATGFTLVSPDTRVVDVGTRFAMRVAPQEPTQVHVLEGLVIASTHAHPEKHELRADQAIEVVSGAARPIPANPARFLTALPSHRVTPTGYLRWSFNELTGTLCRNDGPGIDGNRADALLSTAEPGGQLPERVPGVFGQGLFLDGESSYLETDFPGIGGARARTIAMWVKVPADWTVQHGYALASWGSFLEPGSAWQFSVNPDARHGPIGHLRVGTHGSYVVGVTDLRDGQWHHVAAVMFEGTQPEVSTHVLLYVDGRLEPAEAKSTRWIDTDTASPNAVKFQIGRNVSPANAPGSPRRFFRGWIDELFVADEALMANQIEILMRENRFAPSSRSEELAGLAR
jgi:hypothetical protein